MKKMIALLVCLMLALGMAGCASAEESQTPIRVASLKGPTSMGLVKLMQDAKNGASQNEYEFSVAGTADEIVPRLVKGELDVALVPCNLASVLYNNTKGEVLVGAINTLGVLYIVQTGDEIQTIEDLKGKMLYSTGKGTTPEFALNAVLQKNGIDPQTDLTIEYKSEATEVAAALESGALSIAMLPQPYVSALTAKLDALNIALSLTEEWDKVTPESALITGVVVFRKAFAQENPEAVKAFLEEYALSTAYVNEHPEEAGAWIEELGIAKAAVAAKAIPYCNIVCITGADMQEKVSGYLASLYEQNPTSVGGQLPDDAFYYIAEK